MTDELSPSNTVRSELVDIATGFLKNPNITNEKMERKRHFLQKKGLTDTEINQAFQLISQEETITQIPSKQSSSFLHRFLKDLAFAGLLAFVIKLIKQSFPSNQTNELNETLKMLQQSIQNMQTSVIKLEQTTDLLNVKIRTSTTNHFASLSIEEIKQEIQELKGLFSSRHLQSPRIPICQPSNNNDAVIIISEHEKKRDDANMLINDN